MTIWRKCEVFKNGDWIEVERGNVKKHDIFRLLEQDIVMKCGEFTAWVALEDAFPIGSMGNFAIENFPVIM